MNIILYTLTISLIFGNIYECSATKDIDINAVLAELKELDRNEEKFQREYEQRKYQMQQQYPRFTETESETCYICHDDYPAISFFTCSQCHYKLCNQCTQSVVLDALQKDNPHILNYLKDTLSNHFTSHAMSLRDRNLTIHSIREYLAATINPIPVTIDQDLSFRCPNCQHSTSLTPTILEHLLHNIIRAIPDAQIHNATSLSDNANNPHEQTFRLIKINRDGTRECLTPDATAAFITLAVNTTMMLLLNSPRHQSKIERIAQTAFNDGWIATITAVYIAWIMWNIDAPALYNNFSHYAHLGISQGAAKGLALKYYNTELLNHIPIAIVATIMIIARLVQLRMVSQADFSLQLAAVASSIEISHIVTYFHQEHIPVFLLVILSLITQFPLHMYVFANKTDNAHLALYDCVLLTLITYIYLMTKSRFTPTNNPLTGSLARTFVRFSKILAKTLTNNEQEEVIP